jgi:hypothetical protein
MKFTSIIALACVMAFASCSKDDTTSVSKKDLLTGGTSKSWKISAVSVIVAGKAVDITSSVLVDACDKDDFITFKSDGAYLEDEGALKCSASSPQSVTGTFTVNAAETEVTTKTSSSTTVYAVSELTSSKFVSTTTDAFLGVVTTTLIPK